MESHLHVCGLASVRDSTAGAYSCSTLQGKAMAVFKIPLLVLCVDHPWCLQHCPLVPCSQRGQDAMWPCGNAGKYHWDLSPSIYRHCETLDCVPGCVPFTKCCCSSSPHSSGASRPQTGCTGGKKILSHPLQTLGRQKIKSHLPRTSP